MLCRINECCSSFSISVHFVHAIRLDIDSLNSEPNKNSRLVVSLHANIKDRMSKCLSKYQTARFPRIVAPHPFNRSSFCLTALLIIAGL